MTMVSFSSGAGAASGYLARPGSEKPGIVVLQEWWGLVPHIMDVADRLTAQGYLVLAPDLYHGKSTVEAEEAHHLMTGLDWGRAAQEIAGAVEYLRQEGCTKVGLVGFCMGGALTMIGAAQGGIDGYAAFYGFPPAGAAKVDDITAPGLIIFGEREEFFSVPDAQAFARRQQAKGCETDVIVYPNASHGFFNDTRPDVYEPSAANDAWRRTLAFFGRCLR